jgi:hypothetical protein
MVRSSLQRLRVPWAQHRLLDRRQCLRIVGADGPALDIQRWPIKSLGVGQSAFLRQNPSQVGCCPQGFRTLRSRQLTLEIERRLSRGQHYSFVPQNTERLSQKSFACRTSPGTAGFLCAPVDRN